jgi:hypothetical protein
MPDGGEALADRGRREAAQRKDVAGGEGQAYDAVAHRALLGALGKLRLGLELQRDLSRVSHRLRCSHAPTGEDKWRTAHGQLAQVTTDRSSVRTCR